MSELDCIYELEPSASELLFSNQLAGQTVQVREYDRLRWLQIDGFSIQSVMHLDKPDALINPVNSAMCLSLVFPERCNNILNIGFGAGAFERCFLKKFPDMAIDSVEANEIIIHLAREYFFIPHDHIIYNNQADRFLEEVEQQYDVILCDIFDEEYHPPCLYKDDFYQNAAKNLNHDGVLSMNLTPKNEADMVQLLLPLRRYFNYTQLLKIDEHNNIVIFAFKEFENSKDELNHRTSQLSQQLNIDLNSTLKQLLPLPESISNSI